jgi:hypothetical protein
MYPASSQLFLVTTNHYVVTADEYTYTQMHFHGHKPQESIHNLVTNDTFLVVIITNTDDYIFQYGNHIIELSF